MSTNTLSMIFELLIMTVILACLMLIFDLATLLIAVILLKQSLSPSNVIAWLQAKDPVTGASIMTAVISIAKHSFAGMLGGSAPKRASAGSDGLGKFAEALATLQAIGQANKVVKKEEPK